MSGFELTEIAVYPVKSMQGIKLSSAALSDRGLQNDRRWMLIDRDGLFLTQRELPILNQFAVHIESDHLRVVFKDDSINVPFQFSPVGKVDVMVWETNCIASVLPLEVNDWLSQRLQKEVRMVFMVDDAPRSIPDEYRLQDEIVSFADGFPLMIIGESSLNDLNDRLENPVSMDRFRTNLVFRGGEPFAEDGWNRIRIGDVDFRVVKPCARCVITTVDLQTAEKGHEPLRTLATYRQFDRGVMFGQNLVHESLGTIRVGQTIEIIS